MENKKEMITIEDILKRKEYFAKKSEETKQLYIPSLGGNIEIAKPDRALCLDAVEMEDPIESDKYFVYEIVKKPNLKNGKLHAEFGCEDNPLDIVDILFETGEITDIVKIATKFAGFGIVEEIEDLKN
ncbi:MULTISPECIES: phage portal protein [unclassified Clostridioides]|uniref:phage portal protein n=1 Tax=unclassified Clostridioides TaxID=2635829 RepID=UPI001D0FB566|nr:phage portal protein [Clostridioides sp. ES-S-0171-01]MCC0689719.1 phage portal protein [Clostridioides sp. ES-S-0056-01]MCC0716783.1 phage portal protein [Clostridioides sp. ES-S-0077-01]